MKNDTRFDRRRTMHVGILGCMWTAHDRGFADNGVRASP
jgi:hypothetical protein